MTLWPWQPCLSFPHPRFQMSDCFRGVVFDGLDTLFARNGTAALLCLLKAIGNREHIYVINMAQDYTAMKAQEKAKKEQEGKAPVLARLSFPNPKTSFLSVDPRAFTAVSLMKYTTGKR